MSFGLFTERDSSIRRCLRSKNRHEHLRASDSSRNLIRASPQYHLFDLYKTAKIVYCIYTTDVRLGSTKKLRVTAISTVYPFKKRPRRFWIPMVWMGKIWSTRNPNPAGWVSQKRFW